LVNELVLKGNTKLKFARGNFEVKGKKYKLTMASLSYWLNVSVILSKSLTKLLTVA
jgi:hypothetical protein